MSTWKTMHLIIINYLIIKSYIKNNKKFSINDIMIIIKWYELNKIYVSDIWKFMKTWKSNVYRIITEYKSV